MLYKDIAQKHKVTTRMVGKLVKQSEQQEDLVKNLKRRRLLHDNKMEAIEEVTKTMLAIREPIMGTRQIQAAVED